MIAIGNTSRKISNKVIQNKEWKLDTNLNLILLKFVVGTDAHCCNCCNFRSDIEG